MAARKIVGEALKYLKKLKKEEKSRSFADDIPPSKKRPKRVKEMSDERLERERKLLDPNLTYEERVELLGGKYKKGGKVTKHKCTRGDGCAKRGKTRGRFV